MNENSASLDTTFLGPSSEAEESEEAAAFDYRTPSDQGCPMAFKNTH